MANENNLTAAQRAALFAQATRQNMQMMPADTVTSGATTSTFILPKARLLSKILLDVKAKINITHGMKTVIPETDEFSAYGIIRRISLDLNNGFAPYVISGRQCAMLNMVSRGRADYIDAVNQYTDDNHFGYWKNKGASATGKENEIRFTLELPVTLNDRDPVGLILLQNEQTVVELKIDYANGADMFTDTEGYTIDVKEITAKPMLETFSIPANSQAFPDLSVLKIVNSRNDSYVGAGQHVIKLTTGNIYRRLIFRILDADGKPLADDDILSNIELLFNQADNNYSIDARSLRMLNTTQYGFTLPKGMYVFDFAYQGVVGLSGTRDYIDTERLTEFWLRFNTGASGRVELLTECISRLQ